MLPIRLQPGDFETCHEDSEPAEQAVSIFPRRTVPGKGVTIHWCCSAPQLADRHLSPFVRIRVESPAGESTTLFESHILLFPPPPRPERGDTSPEPPASGTALPFLVMADSIKDAAGREAVIRILNRLRAGRHFYFPFPVSHDAPLGRYRLVSEMHVDGEVHGSETRDDDFFFVESVLVDGVVRDPRGATVRIRNPSPEPVPVRFLRCTYEERRLVTDSREMTLPPSSVTHVPAGPGKCLLWFSEDREVINLSDPEQPLVLRNQDMLSLRDAGGGENVALAVPREGDTAFELTGERKKAWDMSACLTARDELLRAVAADVYQGMLDTGLLTEHRFPVLSRTRDEDRKDG